MGSGVSREYVPPARLEDALQPTSKPAAGHAGKQHGSGSAGNNNSNNAGGATTAASAAATTPVQAPPLSSPSAEQQAQQPQPSSSQPPSHEMPRLLGKNKYVKEYGALVMEHPSRASGHSSSSSGACSSPPLGMLLLFVAPVTEELVFTYHEVQSDSVFARRFSDTQLAETKNAAGVRFSWAPFFKSLATAMLKGKAAVTTNTTTTTTTPPVVTVSVVISSSKESTLTYPFAVELPLLCSAAAPDAMTKYTYVLAPLTRAMQHHGGSGSSSHSSKSNSGHAGGEEEGGGGAGGGGGGGEAARERAQLVARMAAEMAVRSASIAKYRRTLERLLPLIRPLREEAAVYSSSAMAAVRELRLLERQLRSLKKRPILKHPLDALYDEGGAQYFQHVPYAVPHHPHEEEPDEVLTACVRAAFPLMEGQPLSSISQVLAWPEFKNKIDSSGFQRVIVEAFEIFKGIDRWDYDVIQLEIITNGNALFYTTYVLLHKLNLVQYFGINDAVLRNFLVAVQASYHPNPYHNAMHGADVTQINYYIMVVAGLADKCKLSKEELLASILAAVVHDFDHPGLNNNFHTRTGAYLATLYNDQSVLENHHIASAFALMRHPRYNVLASLSDSQRQTVRETMLAMVLATDMGRHADIFNTFRARLSATSDWASKKEDVQLALCMSIKMADVSNCARPNHIYTEWAKNITEEFYMQGDSERELALGVSPFMDRNKSEDFPRGQMSFMMYIVMPMLEAISALLPSLGFAIGLCNENRDYWRRRSELE